MQKITIYMRPTCPYCQKAIFLLDDKKVPYETININQFPEKRDEMIAKANGKNTVPQIFIGETHVGGCDDLFELEESGKLDQLINA